MNLGQVISSIRKNNGIKQGDFAAKVGISQTYLSLIETNKKEPNMSVIHDISKVLKIPIPLLFLMAIEKNDIPNNKRNAFEKIQPSLLNFVKSFSNPNG